jgi:hypothetical protein
VKAGLEKITTSPKQKQEVWQHSKRRSRTSNFLLDNYPAIC